MTTMQIYIVLSIAVLAIVAVLLLIVGRDRKEVRLTPLAGLAFALILAGIFFGDDRLIGYGLMGVGVLLAVIDVVIRLRRR